MCTCAVCMHYNLYREYHVISDQVLYIRMYLSNIVGMRLIAVCGCGKTRNPDTGEPY